MTNEDKRIDRLQRECHVSAVPALLLCAACAVLVLVLGLNALLDETTAAQAGVPTLQALPPAA
jgi:aspartate-semialdehyde dehydrogenase